MNLYQSKTFQVLCLKRVQLISCCLALLLVNSAAVPAARVVDTARIAAAESEPGNWLTHGGTYNEQRYSRLQQVNNGNVNQLGLAWSFELDTSRGQEGTPLVVDGVMYVTTAWSKVVALDAGTGRRLWAYDPKVPGATGIRACCDVVNRGAAFYAGKVYVGTLDGRLIALNARTGHKVWSVMTVDPTKPYTITGAPRAAKGKIYIGNGGAEYGVRGYVSAYDAETGALSWRFYTVPGQPGVLDGAASDEIFANLANPTWHGNTYWQYGGGGTVWDSIVYDPELDQLYIGTGNGSPWNHKIRSAGEGDNLFLASIVALNPDTGKYLWHYQETPGESWDFSATQQITLAKLPVDGVDKQVILHAPKNGFFYVIDRHTGRPLSAEKFSDVNWATKIDLTTGRPVEAPNARFVTQAFFSSSGASGAHNWFPMAYDPEARLVFIPAQRIPFLYVNDEKFVFRPEQWNLGVDMMGTRLPTTPEGRAAMRNALEGWLLAWDPVAQREVWRVPYDRPWNGGVLATAGKLVFQGTATAKFRAYDSSNGTLRWEYAAPSAMLGGAIAYSIKGQEYIAIMAGNGGGLPLTLPAFDGPQPRTFGQVLAFKLGGTAKLPPAPTIGPTPAPPNSTWSEAVIERGRANYAAHCASCHGMETLSAGVLPDLRRSALLSSDRAWRAVVLEGALTTRGMVGFSSRMDADNVESIRAYVVTEALRAQNLAKPTTPAD